MTVFAAPLTWHEIRARATRFAHDWSAATDERAQSQTFWNEFFEVFGVRRRDVAVYEQAVKKYTGKGKENTGFIDLFWPGLLIAEHKSAGRDLDAAYQQALDYCLALQTQRPRYIIVADFQRLRLHDLEENTRQEIALQDLPAHIEAFSFIAGYEPPKLRDEPDANIKAVEKLGLLHDALRQDGYTGAPLEKLLVRILFCLFADDTGLFTPKDSFLRLMERTREDGSDTGSTLTRLFQILNTKIEQRQHAIAEDFAPFPYVNGHLFEEGLPIPEFDSVMRQLLLDCCLLQWGSISPAIFGAMFQKVIELDASDRRRQLGAHYTSEENILKLIRPLFLDELRAEFEKVRNNKNALFEFHKKLRTLQFLDPACGCGNFLVITYRELRRLELDVLIAAKAFGTVISGTFSNAVQVNVDQFYGIEIEEFPAQIAQVAMWLTDHQMNLEAGRAFEYFNRLPLEKSAHIRHGNALRLEWESFIAPERLNYILGNPPFAGKQLQTTEQKEDLAIITQEVQGAGVLDYVACWYLKAAQYLTGSLEGFASPGKRQFADVRFKGKAHADPTPRIADIFVSAEQADEAARRHIRCAFVSTNSITQGEQVGVLWCELFRRRMQIRFAHRTFKWSNEAPGKAAVHCVIIGFDRGEQQQPARKRLFDYEQIDGPAHEITARNINPYLLDAPDVVLQSRRVPLCQVPLMVFGSMPNDGGHLLLTDAECAELLAAEPKSKPWIRPFLGADEFINGIPRWCLWLVGIPPETLNKLPLVRERVERVRQHRASSRRAATQRLAATSTLFGEIRQPDSNYLMVPGVSSEQRAFIPIGFLTKKTIASNATLIVPNATLYHFGIMSSTLHMAWVRCVCGRLKSDFRYSAQIVYNNFPWPQKADGKHRAAIEAAAQAVLDARAAHPGATLAQLYGPDTMPPNLAKAHALLDRAVDAAYVADGGPRTYATEAQRTAFLFTRYQALTSLV